MAGLGDYAYNTKGYKRVATLAEDYSFPYTQVFGFMAPFCKAGGHVVKKFWVPIGTKDFSSVIAAMPDNIDAIYVVLGGADGELPVAVSTGRRQAPLVGGSVTVDQTILGSKGKIHDVVIGTPSAGPIADDNKAPEWQKFVASYKKQPNAFPSPSLFAQGYYINMKARPDGACRRSMPTCRMVAASCATTLASLVLDTPTGKVTLDKNRQAIADNFLTEVAKKADGTSTTRSSRSFRR